MDFKREYLKELLKRYEQNFDITENYVLEGETYPAYAWFYSFNEKYVLRKEAQLWAVKAYEHVIFMTEDFFNGEKLQKISETIEKVVEPVLVRKNNKYPEKDHMCSYITFIVVTDHNPDEETKRKIKKFNYDRGYLFNFRGHSEGRLAVISMDSGNVYTNRNGRELKNTLQNAFSA